VDVANALDYTKASISRAMHILKENGYIEIARSGQIELTEKGYKKAEDIYERHILIARFLETVLELDAKTAEQDACRIEHVISEAAFEAMRSRMKKEMGY
jgi:Mn-dependent DtxR family transcriptional regulator